MTTKIKLFSYFIINQFGGALSHIKWTTFIHNGVLFPEPYKPHKTPLIYDNEKIILNSDAEEYATIYSKFIDSEYVKNKVFNKNFFNDWKYYLKKGGFTQITDFSKCDFKLIQDHVIKYKEEKLNMSKEEKLKEKEKKDKFEEKFKTAIVDGKEQATGNFRIEPPGIFLGRGCHPKAGKIKRRIFPEDITINIDKTAPVPQMPPFYKDHKWNKVIHDNSLEWLASWKDDITGKVKYVWMGAKSDFKAKSDQNKFDLARKLKKLIVGLRRVNFNNIILQSTDEKTKQLASALYLIDKLALRVGNEKGDDEADTVGVCSLRVEHIELKEDNKIKLDFLGKDSVRYQNTVKIDDEVYKILGRFINGKKKSEDIFDLINPTLLNNYLKSMMEDLTAKVFRTYNASNLFQEELNSISKTIDNFKGDEVQKVNLILDMYNKANVKVATLCNHQKNVSKSFNDQLVKINNNIKELKNEKKRLEKIKEENKINNSDNSDNSDNLSEKSKKNNKKINEKIKKIKNKINEKMSKRDLKMELKNLSLTTSKTNYIDPRITVAFFKKHNLDLNKIFSQTLIDKFFWAMNVDKDWTF
jgi:DNA topoisomerase-1